MEEIQNKLRKRSLATLLLLFSIFYGVNNMRVASFGNKDISSTAFGVGNDQELYCSKESCKELRERVESLEEAFRERVASLEEAFLTMVSTLSDEKNQHFTAVNNQWMGKYRTSRSIPSPSLAPSDNLQEDENQQPTETSDSSHPKPRNFLIHTDK